MSNDIRKLRIRAYLQTGVISDQFLPLDSILYYHIVRREMGSQIITKSGESNIRESQGINMPFKRGGPRNEAYFYHCSFAQWPQHTIEDKAFYVKRFNLERAGLLDGKKRKVDTSRGRFKAYHVDVFYRHAAYIDWYAVGDKPEIEKLLQFCTHLGKKTAQGWGSVLEWEVIEWPEDWSVRGPGNKLMRAVPILGNGFLYGVRPSYWNQRHIFSCKMPD